MQSINLRFKSLFPFVVLMLGSGLFSPRGAAQSKTETAPPPYNKEEVFSPLFYPFSTEERGADGRPGKGYWQNRADYSISVALDTVRDRIDGKVTIRYTNNSPRPLDFVWLQLDQNFKRKDSRYVKASIVSRSPADSNEFTNGFEIKQVEAYLGKAKTTTEIITEDTRMQIRLAKPVAAKGGVLTIVIEYGFVIPEQGGNRMGITRTSHGKIYQIAQWYPRMTVYDDVKGWNVIPYQIGSEFYLPYGDFNYNITVPAGILVMGSGALLNEKEVLTGRELKRLEAARRSDRTVLIRGVDETRGPAGRKLFTWKFKCEQTRDVAWAASAGFIWDAARINLPEGKKALAMSVYPAAANKDNAWKRSTAFTKAVVETNSRKWYPYPYPAAINVAGNVGGMEYPGIVFCDINAEDAFMWEVTNHEFGHTWFPMIVGSNEREYGWMDEGFNNFISELVTRQYNKGEFYQSRVDSLAQWQIRRLTGDASVAVMNTPMVASYNEVYWKPAVALRILRNYVLDSSRFDYAFKSYIHNWAFKHPTPWDFFRCMDNAAGEDLSWFWRGWFLHNWKLDQAVESVHYVTDNDSVGGVRITISNRNKMVMPVRVRVTEQSGISQTVSLPVEIWQKGPSWTFWYPSTSPVSEVLLDPENQLPDAHRQNNMWVGQPLTSMQRQ